MKIFVDSANLLEIEEALERGFPSGITTNPSILAKEEKADFREHINKIIELVQRYGYDIPLSVEVFSTRPEEMITQAEDFVRYFGHYPKLNVKIPVGWDELAVFRERAVPCEIIVGSIRHIADISESFQAGADIVTVPPKFFRAMVSHPKTDEAVRQFVTDFQKWMQ